MSEKLYRREIRLTEEQIQKVADLAAAEDRSFPAMLRIMVDSYRHQPTCREHHSPATLDDTSLHVGETTVPLQSHTSAQNPPYIETCARDARLTTYHRDNVARDTRKQEQEHNVTQQHSIGHGGSAYPGAVDWTPEQIREARDLRDYVIATLESLASDGWNGYELPWFTGKASPEARAALLQQCLIEPDRGVWKQGVMWLLLAGSTKAKYMASVNEALKPSKAHGICKLLCAGRAMGGYKLTMGNMCTPRAVLDGELPECWYGMKRSDEKLTEPERLRVMLAMKADAPLQLKRLRTVITKEYRAQRAAGKCGRRARLYLLTDWPVSARYAGVLVPLIGQVVDAIEAEEAQASGEAQGVEVAA